MSAVDPLNAMFAILGLPALGLTGIAIGPLAAPLLVLLAIGARMTTGG